MTATSKILDAELQGGKAVVLQRGVRHRRRTIWSQVKDFLQDNNAALDFEIKIGTEFPAPVGSCGLHPDEAMMASEPINRFDLLADTMGWDIQTRKIEYWIWEKLRKTNRLQWIENQVVESLKTGSAPLAAMTPEETSWFLREIAARKIAREKRREYKNK